MTWKTRVENRCCHVAVWHWACSEMTAVPPALECRCCVSEWPLLQLRMHFSSSLFSPQTYEKQIYNSIYLVTLITRKNSFFFGGGEGKRLAFDVNFRFYFTVKLNFTEQPRRSSQPEILTTIKQTFLAVQVTRICLWDAGLALNPDASPILAQISLTTSHLCHFFERIIKSFHVLQKLSALLR